MRILPEMEVYYLSSFFVLGLRVALGARQVRREIEREKRKKRKKRKEKKKQKGEVGEEEAGQ